MSIKRTNARYLIYIIASSSLFSPSFSSAHKARTLSLDCNRFVSPSRHPVSLTPACRVRVWICLQSALPHSRPIESVFVFSSFGSNADAAIVSTVFFLFLSLWPNQPDCPAPQCRRKLTRAPLHSISTSAVNARLKGVSFHFLGSASLDVNSESPGALGLDVEGWQRRPSQTLWC